MAMKRRNFIKLVTAGSLATSIPLNRNWAATDPDLVIQLSASPDSVSILKGLPTSVLRFTGRVLKGRRDALRQSGSYLGPILDLNRGEHVRIHFENNLDESSIVHWHGFIIPEAVDGHPRFAVPALSTIG
jgi:FtsP/CotA-like multicopper oxidase with cupredoxin domain